MTAGWKPPHVTQPAAATPPRIAPIANVYACLVHERIECVIDLVRNLREQDPDSRILLYDGSASGTLLDPRLPWSRWGVERCPKPRPMHWGKLHEFAFDCIRYLHASHEPWESITIVDSDQLALRPGYTAFLAERLPERAGLGLLSSSPRVQGPATHVSPAMVAHQEIALWRPFLARFADGEQHFAHWTFWPATVMFRDATWALLELFDKDTQLSAILNQSKLWATEEVLFPTLTKLLGFRIELNPCNARYIKYRVPYSQREVDAALSDAAAYFMHPVPREYGDAIRAQVRRHHAAERSRDCAPREATPPHPEQLWPMLRTMHTIEGWFEDEEAELLALATRNVLRSAGPKKPTLVEVGSYCGRATFVLASLARASATGARVHAVDTFDGTVGALGQPSRKQPPSLDKFKHTLKRTGLQPWVETHACRTSELRWNTPIDLLLIDGLHDYASVAQDFSAFEAHLAPHALIAFHDCAEYFPDVGRFVDELVRSEGYCELAQAGSLKLLGRRSLALHAFDAAQEPTCQA